MRLICPNCDAQYEVADNVIPEEGRDVQCSNCGTTWFQEGAAEAKLPDPEPAEDADTTEAAAATEPDDQPEPEGEAEVAEAGEIAGPDEAKVAAAPGDEAEADYGLPKSTVSDEAAQILREEAMRELKARLAEGPRLESQSDLGLQDPAPEPRAVEPVPEPQVAEAEETPAVATSRPVPVDVPSPVPVPRSGAGRDSDIAAAVEKVVGSTRDRLPDIEEINSTLSASSARAALSGDGGPEQDPSDRRRRAGFRVGFLVAMLVGVLVVGVYAYAPQIARNYPEMAPVLGDFVVGADNARTRFNGWVADTVRSLTRTLDSAVSSEG